MAKNTLVRPTIYLFMIGHHGSNHLLKLPGCQKSLRSSENSLKDPQNPRIPRLQRRIILRNRIHRTRQQLGLQEGRGVGCYRPDLKYEYFCYMTDPRDKSMV